MTKDGSHSCNWTEATVWRLAHIDINTHPKGISFALFKLDPDDRWTRVGVQSNICYHEVDARVKLHQGGNCKLSSSQEAKKPKAVSRPQHEGIRRVGG